MSHCPLPQLHCIPFCLLGTVLCLAGWLNAPAQAQQANAGEMAGLPAVGQTLENFSWPTYDLQGNKRMEISGSKAYAHSSNRIEITDVNMQFFQAASASQPVGRMTIKSPLCDFWTSANRMRTRSGIKIERDDMVITAGSIDWDLANERGVLRENVRVELKGVEMGGAKTLTSTSANPKPRLTDAGGTAQPKPTESADDSSGTVLLPKEDQEPKTETSESGETPLLPVVEDADATPLDTNNQYEGVLDDLFPSSQ